MGNILLLNKPVGISPLDAINEYKRIHPEYEEIKMGYAGRLDPMADGLILILLGVENKKRKEYERLSKTYEAEILFGLETDSYDVLGIITNAQSVQKKIIETELPDLLQSKIGVGIQEYPPYSSARINGKPLFYWARAGKLNKIKTPTKEIEIYTILLQEISKHTKEKIEAQVFKKLDLVQGNFRQGEIKKKWKEYFGTSSFEQFVIAKLTISCSSGTYIRSLAQEIGEKLECGATLFSLTRTGIGEYSLNDVEDSKAIHIPGV